MCINKKEKTDAAPAKYQHNESVNKTYLQQSQGHHRGSEMHQHQLRTHSASSTCNSNSVAIEELTVQQRVGGTQTQTDTLFGRAGCLQD